MSEKNRAAVSLGKRAGMKRLREGGREAFVDMAKKSWENRKKPVHSKEYYQEMRRRSGEAKLRKKLLSKPLDKASASIIQ